MIVTVVANPGGRRLVGFAQACAAAGLAAPRVVPWVDVLRGTASPADFGPGPVRIDSPGEDAAVHALLAGTDTPADPHRVEGGAARNARFVAALDRIRALVAAAPGAWPVNDPDEIAVLFDKRRTHAALERAGIAVPDALGPVTSYARLREHMRERRLHRVFVKPAHGSSASGVVALEIGGSARQVRATAAVELRRVPGAGDIELYNSLRIARFHDEPDIAALIDVLCRDTVHVERWVPKLTLAGRAVDLRVLVVAGRPTHIVGRGSHSPMTNLHLGNERVDAREVRAAVGARAWDAALSSCVRAADCFPRTLHVGVDLLFAIDRARHVIGEVNAFGDLLPGVLHAGRSTWDEQVGALTAGWRPGDALVS